MARESLPEPDKAKQAALRLLSLKDRSEAEVRKKLERALGSLSGAGTPAQPRSS